MAVRVDDIRALSSSAVGPDGSLRPFAEQVRDYAFGAMPSGDQFVVSPSTHALALTMVSDLPLLMRQRTMRKVQADHDISLDEITRLPEWIRGNVLAMESITEENALVVVADATDIHGNDIVVALHPDLDRRGVDVNEVASTYGKRNLAYLIENTVNLDKKIYTNDRTGDWILRTGLPLPERIASRLQDDYRTENSAEQFQDGGPKGLSESLAATPTSPLASLQRRADAIADRWPTEELSRVTDALMRNGTVYDAREGVLLESYALEDPPTVEAFALPVSELASAQPSQGEHTSEAQPGRHLETFDLARPEAISRLNSLAQALSDDLAAGEVRLTGDMGELVAFARAVAARAAAKSTGDGPKGPSRAFTSPVLRGLAKLAPRETGPEPATLDPGVGLALAAGVDFYSPNLGVLVAVSGGNTPSERSASVMLGVPRDAMAKAVSALERRRASDLSSGLRPVAPGTFSDAAVYLPTHGEVVRVEGESSDMAALGELLSRPSAAFVRGREGYGGLLASGRVAELAAEPPARESGHAPSGWALEALREPDDLWSPERGILAVSYMMESNYERSVEVYEGVDERTLREALRLAEPGAKLSDAANYLECSYVVGSDDHETLSSLCSAIEGDASFMTGEQALSAMRATDAISFNPPIGYLLPIVPDSVTRDRGVAAARSERDFASRRVGAFARCTEDVYGHARVELALDMSDGDWADVAAYESSLEGGDADMPETLRERLAGSSTLLLELPSASELVGTLLGDEAFGFGDALEVAGGHADPGEDRETTPCPSDPCPRRAQSPLLSDIPGLTAEADTHELPTSSREGPGPRGADVIGEALGAAQEAGSLPEASGPAWAHDEGQAI